MPLPFSLRGKGEGKKWGGGEEERGQACGPVAIYLLPPRARPHGTPPPFKRYTISRKTHLFVGLAKGTLLERFTDIFAPAREEPGTERGVVHEDDFSRGRLDDDHARREEKIVRPETAVWDRRRRVDRVVSGFGGGHPPRGTAVVGGGGGGGGGVGG